MAAPRFTNSWNPNTILLAMAIAGTLIGWGMTYATIKGDAEVTSEALLQQSQRISAIEQTTRTLDNHELRISAHDRAIADLASDNRETTRAVAEMRSDIRVIRQILEQQSP